MTTISITLDLDAEQTASLQKRADDVQPSPLTLEQYLIRSLNAEIASYVELDFNTAAQRLVDATKSLPYEQRTALMTQVEAAIST
jgi:hypothetical protein